MIGLVLSQVLPGVLGNNYESLEVVTGVLLYVALSFIMINVGREFVLDKTKWKSYVKDYFVAMGTAALPWIFVVILLYFYYSTS